MSIMLKQLLCWSRHQTSCKWIILNIFTIKKNSPNHRSKQDKDTLEAAYLGKIERNG